MKLPELPYTEYDLASRGDGYSEPRILHEQAYDEEQVRALQLETAKAVREECARIATNTELPADDRYIAGIVAGTIRRMEFEP